MFSLSGTVMLVVLGMLWHQERISPTGATGVFVGLFGGFLLVLCETQSRRRPRWSVLLHGTAIVLSPLGCLLLLPFSGHFAGGYILGLSVMAALGWAIWESTGFPDDAERSGDR